MNGKRDRQKKIEKGRKRERKDGKMKWKKKKMGGLKKGVVSGG